MNRAVMSYVICAIAAIAVAACDAPSQTGESVSPRIEEASSEHVAIEGTPTIVSADDDSECCIETCGDDCANCRHCGKAAAAAAFHYSPFYVELQGEGEFDLITFKDVGLKRKDVSPTHPLLEVIAESLSYSISESELGYGPAMVSYDERLADPENHRACGQNHLYVDVWKTGNGSFGYSLWSGCGEADKFAWHELETVPVTGDSLAEQVEPLAKSITESIADAKESQCFRKQC